MSAGNQGIEAPSFQDVDRTGDARAIVAYLDTTSGAESVQAYRRRMLQALGLCPGQHVLDVGCGTGEELYAMARQVGTSGRAVGLDLSERILQEARLRSPSDITVELQLGDAHALPFADASFDVVRAERTFQHLADPARALSEMARVARPGGLVAVAEPDWQTLVVAPGERDLTRRILEHRCDQVRNGWIGRQLAALFSAAGLIRRGVYAESLVLADLEIADAIFQFRASALGAADAGCVAHTDAERFISGLEAAARDGSFFAATTGFVALGCVAACERPTLGAPTPTART